MPWSKIKMKKKKKCGIDKPSHECRLHQNYSKSSLRISTDLKKNPEQVLLEMF